MKSSKVTKVSLKSKVGFKWVFPICFFVCHLKVFLFLLDKMSSILKEKIYDDLHSATHSIKLLQHSIVYAHFNLNIHKIKKKKCLFPVMLLNYIKTWEKYLNTNFISLFLSRMRTKISEVKPAILWCAGLRGFAHIFIKWISSFSNRKSKSVKFFYLHQIFRKMLMNQFLNNYDNLHVLSSFLKITSFF